MHKQRWRNGTPCPTNRAFPLAPMSSPHPAPDIWHDAIGFALVEYEGFPLALEITTKDGRRVGAPLTRSGLASLLDRGKAALETMG